MLGDAKRTVGSCVGRFREGIADLNSGLMFVNVGEYPTGPHHEEGRGISRDIDASDWKGKFRCLSGMRREGLAPEANGVASCPWATKEKPSWELFVSNLGCGWRWKSVRLVKSRDVGGIK